MRAWLRKSRSVLKALLALAILVAIGRQLVRDLRIPERGLGPALEDLWHHLLHPAWLLPSAALYLLGLGFGAVYWFHLLLALGEPARPLASIRAHFVGQMGKYLPGKAWALVVRAGVVRGDGVGLGIALMTSFYEVLTTMAAGALLATVVFTLHAPDLFSLPDLHEFRRLLPRGTPETGPIDPRVWVWLSLALFVVIGGPILPPIFNRIAHRIAAPFRVADAAPLPRVRTAHLLEGLVVTSGCWLMMGASVWAILQAVLAEPPAFTLETWSRYTAFMALAYVAGFVIIVVPSGLGVREFLLLLFLVPEISQQPGMSAAEARDAAALAVVLLRLLWTAAEVVIVGVLYYKVAFKWLPGQRS
jgi:hypothetical protein